MNNNNDVCTIEPFNDNRYMPKKVEIIVRSEVQMRALWNLFNRTSNEILGWSKEPTNLRIERSEAVEVSDFTKDIWDVIDGFIDEDVE
jgi:hypothetical protein